MAAQVRAWVLAEIGEESATVLVTELTCTEPGCPPIETVIGLLGTDGQTQYKIHKPLAEVSQADVLEALRSA
ncbi:MAG: hypothetical protein AAF547_22090 [Actinomycetota bacterium]